MTIICHAFPQQGAVPHADRGTWTGLATCITSTAFIIIGSGHHWNSFFFFSRAICGQHGWTHQGVAPATHSSMSDPELPQLLFSDTKRTAHNIAASNISLGNYLCALSIANLPITATAATCTQMTSCRNHAHPLRKIPEMQINKTSTRLWVVFYVNAAAATDFCTLQFKDLLHPRALHLPFWKR